MIKVSYILYCGPAKTNIIVNAKYVKQQPFSNFKQVVPIYMDY